MDCATERKEWILDTASGSAAYRRQRVKQRHMFQGHRVPKVVKRNLFNAIEAVFAPYGSKAKPAESP